MSMNKDSKVCISKPVLFLGLLGVFIAVFVLLVSYITNRKTSTNTRAAELDSTVVSKNTLPIIGGTPTVDGEFPFYVLLGSQKSPFQCGGALISPEWVLTTGTCAYRFKSDPSSVYVSIGVNKNNYMPNGLHFSYADKVIPHEKLSYRSDPNTISESFDVALIHLRTPAVGVPTISLFDPNNGKFLEELAAGMTPPLNQATTMGFGFMIDAQAKTVSSGLSSSNLTKTSLAIDYRRLLLYYDKINLYDNLYDLAHQGEKPVRMIERLGEFGSPAIYNYQYMPYLLGVASISEADRGAGIFQLNNSYFTSTSYYFSWIQQTTGKYGTMVSADSGTYKVNNPKPVLKRIYESYCSQFKTEDDCAAYPCAFDKPTDSQPFKCRALNRAEVTNLQK